MLCSTSLRPAKPLTSGFKGSLPVLWWGNLRAASRVARHSLGSRAREDQQPVLSAIQGSVAQPHHLAKVFVEPSTELTEGVSLPLESLLSGPLTGAADAPHLPPLPLWLSHFTPCPLCQGFLFLSLSPDFFSSFHFFSSHFLLTFSQILQTKSLPADEGSTGA